MLHRSINLLTVAVVIISIISAEIQHINATACTKKDDCFQHEVCDHRICKKTCAINDDCTAVGEACDQGICRKTCIKDADCNAGKCYQKTCKELCTDDAECISKEVCDQGICKKKCTKDVNCTLTELCVEGICQDLVETAIRNDKCKTTLDCKKKIGRIPVCHIGYCIYHFALCTEETVTRDCAKTDHCNDGHCIPSVRVAVKIRKFSKNSKVGMLGPVTTTFRAPAAASTV